MLNFKFMLNLYKIHFKNSAYQPIDFLILSDLYSKY
jgi:hypothetical protein